MLGLCRWTAAQASVFASLPVTYRFRSGSTICRGRERSWRRPHCVRGRRECRRAWRLPPWGMPHLATQAPRAAKAAARARRLTPQLGGLPSISEASRVPGRPTAASGMERVEGSRRAGPFRSQHNERRHLPAERKDGEPVSSVSKSDPVTNRPPRRSPAARAAAPAVHSASWRC